VLGLTQCGVRVSYSVAIALNAPLDLLLGRKLGMPGPDELAMGAIASSGIRILNNSVVQDRGIPESVVEVVTKREVKELNCREREYRSVRPPVNILGKPVIAIDDGLASRLSGDFTRAAFFVRATSSGNELRTCFDRCNLFF
jgi:predicted phosphoribosyltransferase